MNVSSMIDMKILKKRWKIKGWKKVLEHLPWTLQRRNNIKKNRDIYSLPIWDRYLSRLDTIRDFFKKNYPEVRLRLCTYSPAYIDKLTETEEPDVWKIKKAKKTRDWIYPKRFKLSDIDINPYIWDKAMSMEEIEEMFIDDKRLYPKTVWLLKFKWFKLDLYPFKWEPGQFIN